MIMTTYDETKWKLVPIEPTDEMIVAGIKAGLNSDGVIMQLDNKKLETLKGVGIEIKAFKYTGLDEYKAMLAASPQPPTETASLKALVETEQNRREELSEDNAILKSCIVELEEENNRLLVANKDAMTWFNVCKADKDALELEVDVQKHNAEALRDECKKLGAKNAVMREALALFVNAEAGNGWSSLSKDCIERIAYDAAKQAIAITPSDASEIVRKKDEAIKVLIAALEFWNIRYQNEDGNKRLFDAPLNDASINGEKAIEAARAAGVEVE